MRDFQRRRFWPMLLLLLLSALGPGCSRHPAVVTILHLNDVYEIDAVEGGRAGGLARVATVLDELRKTTPPVLTTLGGDYLSPSAIGTARVDGKPLDGRQMVDVLNALGVEWATFGNHEFDVSEGAFHERIKEGKFRLVSSNVTDIRGQPFQGTVPSVVVLVRAGGLDLRIGLIGLTIDANRQSWVGYRPPVEAAEEQVKKLKGQVDAIVALTHLSLAADQKVVSAVPDIDLVLGGHEHENWMIRRGPTFTPIVKADANARSVAVVSLTFGARGARPTVSARLRIIDAGVTPDPTLAARVSRWMELGFQAFTNAGFTPREVVATIREELDGREATVRNGPGELTTLVAASLVRAVGTPEVDVAIFNSGAVRIDDVLPPGPITQYDVIRVLPFGGKVLKATLDGSLLARVLDAGLANRGTGGYLQTFGVDRVGDRWLVRGEPLDPSKLYPVAVNEFLLTGKEHNLGFLRRDTVRDLTEFDDIRRAVIAELKARYRR